MRAEARRLREPVDGWLDEIWVGWGDASASHGGKADGTSDRITYRRKVTPMVCCGRASVVRQASSRGGRAAPPPPPPPLLPGSVERERSTSSISVSLDTSRYATSAGGGFSLYGGPCRIRSTPFLRWGTLTYLQAALRRVPLRAAPRGRRMDQAQRVLQRLGHGFPGWLASCVDVEEGRWVRGRGKEGTSKTVGSSFIQRFGVAVCIASIEARAGASESIRGVQRHARRDRGLSMASCVGVEIAIRHGIDWSAGRGRRVTKTHTRISR